jgi:hypothetical protein
MSAQVRAVSFSERRNSGGRLAATVTDDPSATLGDQPVGQ